jgi:Zn-dependent protease with chaperone function
MRLLICMILMVSAANVLAQSSVFVGSPVTDTIPADILAGIRVRLSEKKKMISGGKIYKSSFVSNLYEKQTEELIKYYNDDYFITEGPLYNYLQEILQKVLKSNPQLPNEVRIFPFRSSVPNALAFWDGTIGFTLGLLAKMENEDQIAFVICHEMAHYYANHHFKGVQEYTRTNFDPALEKQLKSIKYGQYDNYTKYKELMKRLGFSFSRHSRIHETEADSLGLSYLMNTSYSFNGAYQIMAILDSAEAKSFQTKIDLEKYFHSEKYPFKKPWLRFEKTSFSHKSPDDEFGNTDTLRTHPDCKKRLVRLKQMIANQYAAVPEAPETNAAVALSVAKRSGFEMIESEYHFKNFGKALYFSLEMLELYPKSKYLSSMVGMSMFRIYVSQKNHIMSKSVSLPNTQYSESYNRFLSFLHNLRLVEIGSLAYYYVTSQSEDYFENEDYLYAFWLVSHVQNTETSHRLIRDTYLEKYPHGKYKVKLNEKIE